MFRPCAAYAASLCLLAAAAPAVAQTHLSLEEAYQLTLDRHPDVRVWRNSAQALAGEARIAALAPPLVASAEIENALGTGAVSGLRGAELTLSLASVLERGGKRGARISLAARQGEAGELAAAAARLDLLAEVARRYLDLLAAQSLLQSAQDDVELRTRAAHAAARRVAAGAAPESVALAAEAALANAGIARVMALRTIGVASRRLALLWGEQAEVTLSASGDPLRLPPVPDLQTLVALLDGTPEILEFATEQRVREARLQLARSAEYRDPQWQFGVRRLQADGDWALVAGFSVPLGTERRARIEAAPLGLRLEAIAAERESKRLQLVATLVDAQAQLAGAVEEADGLGKSVLPRWLRADAAAEKAYLAGAISYLEWAQIQEQAAASRRAQLMAAINAHRSLIELQRLTAAPFGTRAQSVSKEQDK